MSYGDYIVNYHLVTEFGDSKGRWVGDKESKRFYERKKPNLGDRLTIGTLVSCGCCNKLLQTG